MRFSRFVSRGFGCLPDGFQWEFPAQGLSIIAGDNEMGKSTFVQALLAGLFGEPTQRDAKRRFMEAFSPWRQPEQGPRLLLEVARDNGDPLAIHRDFAAKTLPLKVFNAYTRQECTRDFQEGRKDYRLGEALTGCSRTTFERSAFISQNDLQNFEKHPDLIAAVEQVVDASETGTTAQEALTHLDTLWRSQPDPLGNTRIMVSNILKRLQLKINELEKEARELESDFQTYQSAFESQAKIRQELNKLEQELATYTEHLALSKLADARRLLEAASQLEAEISMVEAKLAELSDYADFPVLLESPIEQGYTRWRDAKARLETLTEQFGNLTFEKEQLEIRLAETAWPRDLASRQALVQALQRFEATHHAFLDAERALEAEAKRLTESGWDLDRFSRLNARLDGIPAELLQAPNRALTDLTALQEKQQRYVRFAIGLGIAGLAVLVAIVSFMGITPVSVTVAAGLPLLAGVCRFYAMRLGAACRAAQTDLIRQVQTLLPDIPDDWESAQSGIKDADWFSREGNSRFKPWMDLSTVCSLRRQDLTNAVEAFSTWCVALPDDLDRATELIATQKSEFENFLENVRQAETLISQLEREQEQLKQVQTHCQSAESELTALFGQLPGSPFNSMERGLAALKEGLAQYRRYVALQTERQHLVSKRFDSDKLAQARLLMDKATPEELEAFPESVSSVEVLQVSLESARTRKEALLHSLHELEQGIRDKQDRYQKRYPVVSAELEEYRTKLAHYEQFDSAVQVAKEVLQTVSSREFDNWSIHLNRRANALLSQLQSPYREMRFTRDFTFSIVDDRGRVYAQDGDLRQLSQGARDQIFFTLRLAITDYLEQRCGHLPLILDDPFVNLDDTRFRHAMETLARLAQTGRQILLFTCHVQRHRQIMPLLAERYPDSVFMQTFSPGPLPQTSSVPTNESPQKLLLMGE